MYLCAWIVSTFRFRLLGLFFWRVCVYTNCVTLMPKSGEQCVLWPFWSLFCMNKYLNLTTQSTHTQPNSCFWDHTGGAHLFLCSFFSLHFLECVCVSSPPHALMFSHYLRQYKLAELLQSITINQTWWGSMQRILSLFTTSSITALLDARKLFQIEWTLFL